MYSFALYINIYAISLKPISYVLNTSSVSFFCFRYNFVCTVYSRVHSAIDYSSFFGWYNADAVAITAPILYTVSRSIYAKCPALFQTPHTKNCERCVGGETNREITTQIHAIASETCVSFIEYKAPSLLVLVLFMLRHNVWFGFVCSIRCVIHRAPQLSETCSHGFHCNIILAIFAKCNNL